MLLVEGLEVFYGRVQALRRVSLRVDPGEAVTLVGPNGAGKTTLLRAIAGLIPVRWGSIAFDGTVITNRPPEAIVRLGISMVPEGRDLFGPLSVRDNLLLGAYARYRRAGRREVEKDLERVWELFPRLRERQRQSAGTLSGGEQQMVAIGRALMARPRFLLLDEPSLGLAPLVIREIFRVIRELQTEGITLLLVEQNARAAFGIARRGYVLEAGGVLAGVLHGQPSHEEVRRVYLGESRCLARETA
ncbi:MAG: ABC transporter ATP-binding protein [Candidatus Rokubacteria bacterium]|nr:ABC transporter ATP-binding protein [Candidatus Rokubacteria bacterium]